MLVTAVVTKAELAGLVESLTPLRVVIDVKRGRGITLNRPGVELVPGRGLRLRGDARVDWDIAGVPLSVTIQVLQLLLVPRVVARRDAPAARVLAFEPIIEELDLKLVPGFVDHKIAETIRGFIAQNRDKIAWDFTRTFTKHLPLPKRFDPAKTFELVPVEGGVAVSATELRLDVLFELSFTRSLSGTRAPDPKVAEPPQSSPHRSV